MKEFFQIITRMKDLHKDDYLFKEIQLKNKEELPIAYFLNQ